MAAARARAGRAYHRLSIGFVRVLVRAVQRVPTTLWLVLAMIALAAVIFGGYVVHGGLYEDDWGFLDIVLRRHGYWSQVNGFSWTSFRPVQMLYWPLVMHLAPHAGMRVWAVTLGVAMSILIFAVLRAVGIHKAHAFAIALLILIFPWSDATRLWPAASVGSLAVAIYLCGLLLAFRAFGLQRRQGLALHAVSLGLYAACLLLYEAPAAVMVLSGLLYLLKTDRPAALRRWLTDVVLVVSIALLFSSGNFYEQGSLGDDVSHAVEIAKEALVVLGGAVVPTSQGSTTIGILALVAVVSLCVFAAQRHAAWARSASAQAAGIVLAGLAIIVLGYAVYLPVKDAFYPLDDGTDNRVNLIAAIGFVLVTYGIVVGATRLAGRRHTRAGGAAAAVLVSAIGVGYYIRLAADETRWEGAARTQAYVLRRLAAALGKPPPGSTVFAFGEPIYQAPGVPVFDEEDDLDAAWKSRWHDTSLHAYPMAAGMTYDCASSEVSFDPSNTGLNYGDGHSGKYRATYVVDVSTAMARRIDDRRVCRAEIRHFQGMAWDPNRFVQR